MIHDITGCSTPKIYPTAAYIKFQHNTNLDWLHILLLHFNDLHIFNILYMHTVKLPSNICSYPEDEHLMAETGLGWNMWSVKRK